MEFVQVVDVYSGYVYPNILYGVFQYMEIVGVRRLFLKFFFQKPPTVFGDIKLRTLS